MYAPGIKQKGLITQIKTVQINKEEFWDFVIQKHQADKRGLHYDVRLAPPGGPGYSWAVDSLPQIGSKVYAIRTEDHTLDYFDFNGEIKDGYGKGTVSTVFRGKVEVIEATPNKITFYWYGPTGTEVHKYTLVHIGDKTWLFINHTISADLKRELPNIKNLRYKDVSKNYKEKSNDFHTPKIDGASSVTFLFGNKVPIVLSKNKSKKTNLEIEYTPKIPGLLNTKIPNSLKTTILRTEVYGVTPDKKELPNRLLGGLLNSSVFKSRATQQLNNTPLQLAAFDVIKYKGQDVSSLPIEEKYKIIDEISKQVPFIKNPLKLQNEITFPEGKVVWRNNKPLKVKNFTTYDVYVRKIYPSIKPGLAGGFWYSYTPNGPLVGKVGTGFTDDVRKDMNDNPSKHIGKIAIVQAQEKLPSGALRSPSFKGYHLDKNF